MINKKLTRIVVFLLALSVSAPVSVWAGYYGHHGYGHHSRYGHGYYSNYSPRFYGPDGNLYRGVGYVGDLGALDLNVKPKTTQVYLNGNYIGVTDKFDGFRDYLWLNEGTHELIFYNEGYATVVREFSIRPGAVIDVRHRMVPGESVPPEDLTSTTSRDSESQTDQESGG